MLSKTQRAIPISKDDVPARGTWCWVTYQNTYRGRHEPKQYRELMCVEHIGSNHVQFTRARPSEHRESYTEVKVHFRNLMKDVVPEPNWKAIIDKELLDKQKELQDAVKALADKVRATDLLPEHTGEAPATMLPSTTRVDPKRRRWALLALKNRILPRMKKRIAQITQEMVALQHDSVLPMLVECDRMTNIKEKIEDRLFVLQLYAGLGEKSKQIAEGEPAPPETPITIRQMLRYMDEETLIDYDKGGADYSNIGDFDDWIAKPENYTRLLPEPRCMVAFKIRRHHKDYGRVRNIWEAFAQMDKHNANEWTYLCIRNGAQIWRLFCDIEFSPRLLPIRTEFHKPFEQPDEWGHYEEGPGKKGFPFGERVYDEPEQIGPEDLRYDDHVEKRKKLIFQYNRILFLIQGILDRSEVFKPHPPINLSDSDAVGQWLRLVHDEETGLPGANPPKWEEYRDRKNASIKVGTYVFAKWTREFYDRYERPGYKEKETKYQGIYQVTSVKKNRTHVRVSMPRPKREGYEFPTGWGNGYGRWGSWERKNKWQHFWVPMEDVFNVDAYVPGEYKTFLCDAYLKGAYLEWAPQLLSAEKHWKEPA